MNRAAGHPCRIGGMGALFPGRIPQEDPMLSIVPVPLVVGVGTTGSALIDVLGAFQVVLHDLVAATGSSLAALPVF